ncbi:MAG: methylmalonyl Co-A mutase-associated GTPase MeaB [Thermoanaerobaculia bacterium]|nr:methylmalonyl Co-A mutase-associated GTPase MeaB [Thermoanaerobaculia bacterium]
MPIPATAAGLAEGVLQRRVPDVARAISWAESGDARFPELLTALFSKTGRARVTGLTGSPGAGKSTLTAALARKARAAGRRVGIVAVDPSSPFSGGAILGDRIRMQDLYTDPGVLIRSMATRGNLGGLARATADAVDVLDAAGYDDILVETVGVGQDEVEVFRLAESCVVVLTPGMGDDIQAIKAGLMEVADLFVVNKADRDGADRVVQEILQMLELGEHGAWVPPILKTVATTGTGIDELIGKLEEHRKFLDGPQGARRKSERTRMRIEGLIKEDFLRRVESLRGDSGALEAVAARVNARMEDPLSAARSLVGRIDRGFAAAAESPSSPSKKLPFSEFLSKESPVPKPENLVSRISHLGIAVKSLAEGGAFWDLLGLVEEHREEVASQKVLTSFRAVGESHLELLESTSPDGPIAKSIEKRGPGIHHLCVEVTDVRAALGRLKAAGVRLVNEEPFDGAHDCLVAFVHPSATGGILLELSEKKAKAD